MIFIIVINLLFYAPLLFNSSSAGPTITLPYTGFLQQVELRNVKEVTLTGSAVSGDFKTSLRETQSGTTTIYPQFTSYVTETGDPTLLPTLEKNGVQITTTGAENDLKEATKMARRMVSEWGMGEQTGPVVYDLSDGNSYLSQQGPEGQPRVYSEATAQRLDAEVERLMTHAHEQARSVLSEHRDALDRLARALLQEEVLEREQVLAIVQGGQNTQDGAGNEQASQKTLMAGS